MHVSAAILDDAPRSSITLCTENGYHACRELVPLRNTQQPGTNQLVRPLMSFGKDEHHVDKHVRKLPIPVYDPANSTAERRPDGYDPG